MHNKLYNFNDNKIRVLFVDVTKAITIMPNCHFKVNN